jgi:hypothetical protein
LAAESVLCRENPQEDEEAAVESSSRSLAYCHSRHTVCLSSLLRLCACRENPQDDEEEEVESSSSSESEAESDAEGEREEVEKRPGARRFGVLGHAMTVTGQWTSNQSLLC